MPSATEEPTATSDPAEQGTHGDRDLPVDDRGNRERPPDMHLVVGYLPDDPNWPRSDR